MDGGVARKRWSEEETVLALYLYFQLPFGKLDQRTNEVRELAEALGRSPSSVAMKLCNFASLDPKIVESGRKGLDGASALDRVTYGQFGQDWTGLVAKASQLWDQRVAYQSRPAGEVHRLHDKSGEYKFQPYQGESEKHGMVAQRVGQGFFRRAVLANYEESCCVTGISDSRLLIASHIRPWNEDVINRHNPANGLLLSATMDKAFDCGLMTITAEGRVKVSRQLLTSKSEETADYFATYEGSRIRSASRFDPDPSFLQWHNRCHFVDAAAY